MDAERWRKVEALYHSALEREPGERAAYLAGACQGDKKLRQEVESLLAQNVSASGVLDRPAWEGADSLLAPPPRGILPGSGQAIASPGRTISHYRIVAKLGEGGMGVVYKAEDTNLERPVALKFPAAYLLESEEHKERFLREAKAAASLDHPNICVVHEVGEVDGQIFFAMGYIDGPEVRAKIKEGPLKLDEALNIAIQAAEGLRAAHERGIVHRDIKSANLMLTSSGQVKIMDFGLVQLPDRSRLTKPDAIMGTPAYMSPEQAQGQPTDRRTDIWSLGVVLYEMVTGRLPFEGEREHAVVYAIINEPHEPITAIRAGVPLELDRILNQALAKKPEERYQHLDDMLVDLRRLRAEPARGWSKRSRVHAARPRQTSRRRAVFAIAGGALVATGAGSYVWFSKPSGVDSLVILPFQLEGASDETGYLAEGLAEGLIANLARAPALRVISRDAAFRYEGRDKDAQTIGADMGVGAVLKGRITPLGTELRISAEVVNASDGSVIWSERFRRPAANLLNLDREMAFAIADRLRLTLNDDEPFEPVAPATDNPEAYRLYLLGRYHWSRRDDSLITARDHFQQAVDLDPGYALAWAGLADAYLMLGAWSLLPPGESHPRAAVAARRAIAWDSSLAEPHATLGYFQVIYERDWTSARREFERAIVLNPDYATAHHWFAFYHLTVGDMAQALAEIRKACDLDPLSPVINVELAYFLFYARRYEESEEAARKALQLDRSMGYAYSELARSYAARGRDAEAREAVEHALALTGNSIFAWMFCGMVLARLGDVAGASRMLANIGAAADSAYVSPQIPGMIYAAMGENDRAFELFDTSVQERSFIASWLRDPLLDDFSKDPRFRKLFDGIGLQA